MSSKRKYTLEINMLMKTDLKNQIKVQGADNTKSFKSKQKRRVSEQRANNKLKRKKHPGKLHLD